MPRLEDPTLDRRVRWRTSIRLAFGTSSTLVGRDADLEGVRTMPGQNFADAVELYSLEHHFPLGWFVAGLIGAGNLAATVATLLAA
jgi:hypothetical protein